MIAALFVDSEGPYADVPGIDPWDEKRDARQYRGPHRVIAHPPCKRWGRYWPGRPGQTPRLLLGDDQGCFASALWSVRTFEGVIEHPTDSMAWRWFGLPRPPRLGWGWSSECDAYGGRSARVCQGRYGHLARKETWLYAVLPQFPALDWSDCSGMKMEESFPSTQARRAAREAGVPRPQLVPQKLRHITPIPFRDALIALVSA